MNTTLQPLKNEWLNTTNFIANHSSVFPPMIFFIGGIGLLLLIKASLFPVILTTSVKVVVVFGFCFKKFGVVASLRDAFKYFFFIGFSFVES